MTKKKLDTGFHVLTYQDCQNLYEVLCDLGYELCIIRFLLFTFVTLELFACGFIGYLLFRG